MLKIIRGDSVKRIITCLIALLMICGCAQKQTELTKATKGVANTTTVCYGTVLSDDFYAVDIQRDAVIEALYFEEGERVKQGDLIAESNYYGIKEKHIAEFDGIISQLQLSVGDRYDAKSNIIVTKTDSLYVTVLLQQRDISIVKAGDTAKISSEAFEKGEYDAVVEKVYSTLAQNGSTARVTAKIKISNPDSSVLPGLSAVAEIKSKTEMEKIILPDSSIGYDGKYYVCNAEGGKIYLSYAKKCDSGYIVEGIDSEQSVLLNVSEAEK